jgi:hypothetical protein
MRHIRLTTFAIVTIPLTLLAGQIPAGLGGRWVAVEPQKIAGHELLITQDAGTLRLEQVRLQHLETFDELGRRQAPSKELRESTTYRLDGQVLVTNNDGQSVRSSLRHEDGRVWLRDVYQRTLVTLERSLSLDNRGRLVLEIRRPDPSSDPDQASERILEIRRIVFERR